MGSIIIIGQMQVWLFLVFCINFSAFSAEYSSAAEYSSVAEYSSAAEYNSVADYGQADSNPCPAGWVQATFVDMGCLFFNYELQLGGCNWEAANLYCQAQHNASLVEIFTEEQQD